MWMELLGRIPVRKILLDVIFASEKRRKVLSLLQDGPKRIEDILESLETTRPVLLPQIRILEEKHLITCCNGICELTPIGELITENMRTLVRITEILDANISYFNTNTHIFNSLPVDLRQRIAEPGSCRVSKPDVDEMLSINKEII